MAYPLFPQLTNEARAETKLVWTMPCKEEEDDSQTGRNIPSNNDGYSLK